MRLFYEDELRRKSFYEMYQIATDEKLIENYLTNPTREEIINIILKYRGAKPTNTIKKYKKNGLVYLQHLFDRKMGDKTFNENKIKVPYKIIIYKDLNITKEDNYKIVIPDYIHNGNVFLVNSNNYLCGIFQLEKDLKTRDEYYLISKKEFLRIENLTNNKFSLVFFKSIDSKFIYNFYNISDEQKMELYPHKLDYYKIEMENFEVRDLEETEATLCIDFGTTNTALGTYIDQHYIKTLPTNDILNNNIKLNAINYVKFFDGERSYNEIFPTIAYVEDCSDEKNIKYLFGYDVIKKLEANDYVINGTLFYGLKKWVHEHDVEERIIDEYGNIRHVKREKIIRAYLKYIVDRAEYVFKCKFKKIHASSPVKLKHQFLEMFQKIFIVNGEIEYEVTTENAMDEAIAVLYNTIERQIQRNSYEADKVYKALIIDCGGGTTDLATCKYRVKHDTIKYNLDISTSFENGDENFGGNNITYRIMQFLKVILASKYSFSEAITVDKLLNIDTDLLYKTIDQDDSVKNIFEKLEKEYVKAEKIIPTRFSDYENKMSGEYKKTKNNFYMLWEASEMLKKSFFSKNGRLRTKFDISKNNVEKNDFHITKMKAWKIHIIEKNNFRTITEFPDVIFTIREIEKIVKSDIYSMMKKFLDTYYKQGKLADYSLIKLSGESTKITMFQEVLKEFVPGKMIEFKDMSADNNHELKLNCLEGVIKYLNYKRFGHMNVNIMNEVPLVPYSIWGEKYNGIKEELLETSEKAERKFGYIDKSSVAKDLKLFLHNAEGTLKKEFMYENRHECYEDLDAEKVIPRFRYIISQHDTDTITNELTRFFIYTDENSWGFYVCPVKREGNQLYLGSEKYYPFEDELNKISFFDGNH